MESISTSFWSANLVPSDGQVGDRTKAEKTSSLPSENPEAGCGETAL